MNSTKWFAVFVFLFTTAHIKVTDGVPVTAIFLLLLAAWLHVKRVAIIDRQLGWLYVAIVVTSVISFLASGGLGSFSSLAYLLILTLPFVLRGRPAGIRQFSPHEAFISGFRRFMILSVLLGIAQLAIGDDFFSVRSVLPEEWLLEGFNTSNRMEVGSLYIYRSNGFFFLEPSFFSQYLAFVILLEMRTRRHLPSIAIMSLGMATSLSGSGFIVLTVGLLCMALRSKSAASIFYTLAPALAICAFAAYFLPSLAERVTELNDEDKSGYWRFVMPILYVYDSYASSVVAMLIGVGPGAAKNDLGTALMAYSSGAGKILFENGLLGAVPIVMIYYRFIMKSFAEQWFAISMLVFVLIVNCGIQEPMTLMVVLLFALFAAPASTATRSPSPYPLASPEMPA